jgi:hypothetical protein
VEDSYTYYVVGHPHSWLAPVLLALLAIAVGVAATTTGARGGARSAITEDDMNGPHRFAQLYGYAVCLIAVVTFLVAANQFVEAAMDLSDPLHGGDRFGPWGEAVPTSFEVFRADYRQRGALEQTSMLRTIDGSTSAIVSGAAPAQRATRDTLSDEALRRLYDAKRADQIAWRRFQALRSLVTNGLLLLLAVGLFVAHWRWLRGLNGRAATGERVEAAAP